MEWVEVRAENIEAAEELALDQLGVAREDAEFEVVTREENRLFGLKKTEARAVSYTHLTLPTICSV